MQSTIRRHPAEWEHHSACWLAFPRLPQEWPGVFEAACAEFAQLCTAIADRDPQTGKPRGEILNVIVFDQKMESQARSYLGHLEIDYHHLPYDDIWLRDTGPIFIHQGLRQDVIHHDEQGSTLGLCFRFNVWGEKFDFPHDRQLSQNICRTLANPHQQVSLVLEGGALETDGEGTCLTTRQCLLNSNRNPYETEQTLEVTLKQIFGYEKIIWLDQGLINDHTDGHIDTLARFVMPGVVMVMESKSSTDPQREILRALTHQLVNQQDAKGRSLQLVTIPSPGKILNQQGQVLPASYLNFYLSNTCVIVPTYGSPFDESAVRAIAPCFPNRRTVGISARAIITQGGAFHCMTQQQP